MRPLREMKPRLAARTARAASLRYKLAGGTLSFTGYSVLVPAVSLMLDPTGQNPLIFLAVTLASSVVLVWGYYAATGMLARRRVLD